jgi:hypothetical protein
VLRGWCAGDAVPTVVFMYAVGESRQLRGVETDINMEAGAVSEGSSLRDTDPDAAWLSLGEDYFGVLRGCVFIVLRGWCW